MHIYPLLVIARYENCITEVVQVSNVHQLESGMNKLAQHSRVPSRFETILMFNQESKAFTGHYQDTHYLQYTPCILKFDIWCLCLYTKYVQLLPTTTLMNGLSCVFL